MSLRLPAVSSRRLGLEPNGVVRRVEEFLRDGRATGYLVVQAASVTKLLFLLHGRTFCAGSFHNDRFAGMAIARFFAELPRATAIELCTTDLPLFLCTAVMFRKAPAAQIPLQLVDSDRLLAHVQRMGKDAVLVVRRGDARSVAFCREGELQALYPASGERFPEGTSVGDRIIEYVYAGTRDELVLDLYDEIRLPPAADAGHPVKSYRQPSAIPLEAQPVLVVQLGDRVVFRYPVLGKELSVGRGGGNDLSLDNLSVSRRHARMRQQGERLVFEDLGSENGLVVGGARVARAELRVGDEVQVGKYLLRYEELAAGESVAEVPAAPASDVRAIDDTIAIPSYTKVGELRHGSRRTRITGLMFNIGKRADSQLRIKGFFAAGLHAQIHRLRDGTYVIEHVGGRTAVKVNGETVQRKPLQDGDRITIGDQVFRFRLVDA